MEFKEKKETKLRHELKYIINPQEDLLITSRLRKLFDHDKNAGSHGSYRVSSRYFDTPYDKALRQKLDGVNMREKFRIRYYGNDLSFIRLEKKFKINGLCGKQSARLDKEEAGKILCGDIDFLINSENHLKLELYSKMRGQLLAPKTTVIYDREAFVYEPGNVRITLDRNISSGVGTSDFFSPAPRLSVPEPFTVLEVKYDEFLPEIVTMAVQLTNRRASAYSKYAVCRSYD